MFLQSTELKTVINSYQIYEITDNDDTIVQSCIIAAIKRVSSYLNALYDVKVIFAASGDKRDPDILEITKNVTMWFLVRKNNIDIAYTKVKEVYDRDIEYLKAIGKGELSADLPKRVSESGEKVGKIRMGSNEKFNHHF